MQTTANDVREGDSCKVKMFDETLIGVIVRVDSQSVCVGVDMGEGCYEEIDFDLPTQKDEDDMWIIPETNTSNSSIY